MRSIKTKFLAIMLTCVLVGSVINGLAGIFAASSILSDASSHNMKLVSYENAAKLNHMLESIEQSVHTLSLFIEGNLSGISALSEDTAYRDAFTERMSQIALNHALTTNGAVSVFLRYEPELTTPTSGFYYIREDVEAEMLKTKTTDLSAHARDDKAAVGWWYDSAYKATPTWLDPYLNGIGKWVISYIVPLHRDGIFFGIIGMDISFEYIMSVVSEISLYDTGYAVLVSTDHTFFYDNADLNEKHLLSASPFKNAAELLKGSPASETELISYTHDGVSSLICPYLLANGMTLVITARECEINTARNRLIGAEILVTLLVLAFSSAVALYFSRGLIRQLREIDMAARNMMEGKLDFSLHRRTNDEAGELAENMRRAQQRLNEQFMSLSAASQRDALTGVKNKNAYATAEKKLDEAIAEGGAEFAIGMFDANFLKETNDTYGHAAGDQLLIAICKNICAIFKHSPVFRVGGDEFVVILQNTDLDNQEALLATFAAGLSSVSVEGYPEVTPSCAFGLAAYHSRTDTCCADVFRRADDRMYENKQKQKAAFPYANGKTTKQTRL